MHRVVRRINEVTGTVYNNGEDMQIVRYEPGQFYKVRAQTQTCVCAACTHACVFFRHNACWSISSPPLTPMLPAPLFPSSTGAPRPEHGGVGAAGAARPHLLHVPQRGGPLPPPLRTTVWVVYPSHLWVLCHPHHGGIPSPTPRPPAPAQVGGGGETYFPNVRDPKTGQQGIMVQPHPGSAILWPSTLDAEPMRADMRTPPAALEL